MPIPPTAMQLNILQTPRGTTFSFSGPPGSSVSITQGQVTTQWQILGVVLHIALAEAARASVFAEAALVTALMKRRDVTSWAAIPTKSVCLVIPRHEYERAREALVAGGLVCDADGAPVDVVVSGSQPQLGVSWRKDATFLAPQPILIAEGSLVKLIAAKLKRTDAARDRVCSGNDGGVPCANFTGRVSRRCPLHDAPQAAPPIVLPAAQLPHLLK